ncbi:MAG: rod shape-determining protein MreC [Fimbriimonadaceae bacterium]
MAVGFLVGSMQNRARLNGQHDLITTVVSKPFSIPGQVMDRALNSGSQSFQGLWRGAEQSRTIERLRSEVKAASLYTETMRDLRAQNDLLRKQLNLPSDSEGSRMPARIIYHSPLENRVTLNIGSSSNVKPGCPVVNGDGLVGIVQVVEKSECQVQLITSPLPFKVGAMIMSEIPVVGLIHGQSSDRLVLDLVDMNAKVKDGDLVVTSGIAKSLIPRGIVIGRVVSVDTKEQFGLKSVVVFPEVQMSQAREVFVLR